MENIFIRESLLQEKVGNKVRCNVCERRCELVSGGLGWCRTRQNRDGKLVSLTYGAESSVVANPIEKKPFYHFYPGTDTFTAGSWSCNFGCPWCQNWQISTRLPSRLGEYISPERFVKLAIRAGCLGTSISFNEPALSLEWSLDVFRLARRQGLYNTYVTNGYMTPEALGLLIEAGLDGMNVDIKGSAQAVRRYCKGIDVEKVWAACQLARAKGVHVEITTLVIPTVNDSQIDLEEIAGRIAGDLGSQVPWHVSAYYPAYRFAAPPTSRATLERAWKTGKDAGLDFVYVGNLPGHHYDNTYCPGCNTLLIRRMGFSILENILMGGRCSHCGEKIQGVWN